MTRTLIDTQAKLIKKELSKEKMPISNKIVLFKSVKPAKNFILSSMI